MSTKALSPNERSRTQAGQDWYEAQRANPYEDTPEKQAAREAAAEVALWPECPRCGDPLDPWGGALSRMDNETEICSPCGQNEALRDFAGAPPVPPDEWPVSEGS